MKIRICFFVLFTTLFLSAQQEEKVVARVGDYKIYESEFQERFDFSAHPKLLNKSEKIEAKRDFLKQLIAEKLLSLNAREKGYDTLQVFSNIISPLRDMYVRDALYSLEIKNKIAISPQEIIEGLERIKKICKVKFIHSVDEMEINDIYKSLKSGASFDSLLEQRAESKDQPRDVTFGTMEKPFEDNLYNLIPGRFTSPLKSEDGYYILKLVDTEPNPDLKDQEMVLDDVKRIVKTRNEYKVYLDYYHNFFDDFRITADRGVFENLISIFTPRFHEKYSDNESAVYNKYYLNGIEVTSAFDLMKADNKNKIFIDLGEKKIKADYFLNKLSHNGFYVRDIDEKSIRASLSSYIRKFIEDELLTIEGISKGLNNSPGVKKYIRMWEDSYLSKMLMVNMFDSIKVSEEEAYSVYKQNDWAESPLELVNILEILTDSLQIVEHILNELSSGKDFRDLAKQYTRRDSLKERGGEFGFFPVTMYDEIGKAALNMEIGDIYGPIKLDGGYSIFQLIGRKTDTTGYTKSYQEVKNNLISHLTLLKFEKYVNEYNAMLANKYGVEIYEDVLNEIENTYLNLVVVRYMGFGGEIFAVPYTEQFSGWYDIWIKDKDKIP